MAVPVTAVAPRRWAHRVCGPHTRHLTHHGVLVVDRVPAQVDVVLDFSGMLGDTRLVLHHLVPLHLPIKDRLHQLTPLHLLRVH